MTEALFTSTVRLKRGPNGSIDTQTSVNGIRHVLEHISPADSGRFINYDGTAIAW